jgi:exonuclease VII large subunit
MEDTRKNLPEVQSFLQNLKIRTKMFGYDKTETMEKFRDLNALYQKQIDEYRTSMDRQVETLKQQASQRVDELRRQRDTQVEEIRIASAKEQENMRARYDEELICERAENKRLEDENHLLKSQKEELQAVIRELKETIRTMPEEIRRDERSILEQAVTETITEAIQWVFSEADPEAVEEDDTVFKLEEAEAVELDCEDIEEAAEPEPEGIEEDAEFVPEGIEEDAEFVPEGAEEAAEFDLEDIEENEESDLDAVEKMHQQRLMKTRTRAWKNGAQSVRKWK